MFIDIHAHAYRKPVPFVTGFCTAEQLIERYDAAGIEKGALLPIVSPEVYFPQTNEDILDMCERYPSRLFPFCNIDPRALTNSADAPLGRVLRYYSDKGARGIGEVMLNLPVMDPLVQNLFKHAQDAGLPLTFDGSDRVGGDFGLYDEPGLPQLEHTLQRFPRLIMLGHGPVFWSEISRLETPAQRKTAFRPDGEQVGWSPPCGPVREEGVVPKLFRRYGNLYGDLSDDSPWNAISRDREYGPKFLAEFQDRLMFGTDICGFDNPFPMIGLLSRWKEEKLISGQVFEKISRENAIKLFRL